MACLSGYKKGWSDSINTTDCASLNRTAVCLVPGHSRLLRLCIIYWWFVSRSRFQWSDLVWCADVRGCRWNGICMELISFLSSLNSSSILWYAISVLLSLFLPLHVRRLPLLLSCPCTPYLPVFNCIVIDCMLDGNISMLCCCLSNGRGELVSLIVFACDSPFHGSVVPTSYCTAACLPSSNGLFMELA